ncbi:MAG: hypothetical protein HPY51_11515 [Candidatus Omnitrophica bacterium]|nr:hypothetical protein [Candidatus Omnitrophota bacterium]
MNILVLRLGLNTLHHAYFQHYERQPVKRPVHRIDRSQWHSENKYVDILREVWQEGPVATPLDAITIQAKYGGVVFSGPVRVDAEVLEKLKKLTPCAPLHVPELVELVEAGREVFPRTPVVLDFETAFFVTLPDREHSLGVDADLIRDPNMRKFGFYGIYHEAARDYALDCWPEIRESSRILSICLEPRPEIAAILGNKPVMVTSGVTPLEGLPGHTTCGDLDPNIVLTLAQKKEWGPEQINNVLTRESGLLGLAGRPLTFQELFGSEKEELKPVQDFMKYRILLACGSGIAAMSGLDAIVFSGQYASAGKKLGPWLISRLSLQGSRKNNVYWDWYDEPIDQLLADRAVQVILTTPLVVKG